MEYEPNSARRISGVEKPFKSIDLPFLSRGIQAKMQFNHAEVLEIKQLRMISLAEPQLWYTSLRLVSLRLFLGAD